MIDDDLFLIFFGVSLPFWFLSRSRLTSPNLGGHLSTIDGYSIAAVGNAFVVRGVVNVCAAGFMIYDFGLKHWYWSFLVSSYSESIVMLSMCFGKSYGLWYCCCSAIRKKS